MAAHTAASVAASGLASLSNGSNKYALYSAENDKELPNEKETQEKLFEVMRRVFARHFSAHRHGKRGTHVKTQAIVKGTLTVLPDLPEHLAQGLFKSGGKEFQVALRYANEPIFIQDDRAPGPRGVSMRVFGVDGHNFLGPIPQEARVQDFTFNNAPILELTDLPTTLEIFTLREKYYDDKEGLQKELKKRSDASLQMAPMQLPNHHFLSYVMYSQSAFRYGKYICKYALFPSKEAQKALADKYPITDSSDAEQHSKWLMDYFKTNDAEYDLRIQLQVSPSTQPVEDTSIQWDETAFPFETVAKLRISAGQDAMSPARRIFWDDKMKLSPWYGLEDHKPLGSVNRLRQKLYHISAETRGELNSLKVNDVKDINEIP